MANSTFEKTISWLIKIGLLLVVFLPLYISPSLVFPFITGKNFAFRFIIEILAALWVGLMVVSPQYRPRLTPLVKLSTIFVFVVFLADLLSPNPYRSFFSNYERMEGFVTLFHLWLYFLLLTSVFKSKKDWLIFAHATLVASIFVGIYGFLQHLGFSTAFQGGYRIESTIGNPTYLAAYTSFHIWLLVLLLRSFWKRWWLRIAYLAVLIFELVIIYLAASRGAAIGLLLSSFVLLLVGVIYWKRLLPPSALAYRKWAAAVLVLIVIAPFVFWQIRNSNLIPPNSVFSRLASISLKEPTTLARFAVWKMSLKGVLERPILGWGQENYYLVFQKYYDPKLFSSEPWFDRSHNIVMDWLVHTGVIGAAAFFSMVGSALYFLWRRMRERKIGPWEGAIVGVTFISYLTQNIFVFDNLNTYLMFFALLAYADSLTAGLEPAGPLGPRRTYIPGIQGRFFAVAGLLLALVFFASYYLHYKPIQEAKTLIRALTVYGTNRPAEEVMGVFKKALSYNSFGDTEVREQLGGIARDIRTRDYLGAEGKNKITEFTAEELRKEINSNPAKDIKHMIFLSAILGRSEKPTTEQLAEAEQLMKEAIRLSPTKQISYFQLGEIYMFQNRWDESVDTLKKAVDLEPSWVQANINLVLVAQRAQRFDVAKEARKNLKYNLGGLDDDNLKRLATTFVDVKDYATARTVYEELVRRFPKAEHNAMLGAVYDLLGEYDLAIEQARLAAADDPTNFTKEAETFIRLMLEKKAARGK